MNGDQSLLRSRRAVEAGQLVARGCGIVGTVLLVAGCFDVFPDGMPRAMITGGLGLIVVMSLAQILGVHNFRQPEGPRYSLVSAAQVACDLVVMCGLLAGVRIYADTTVWPGLLVPIVAAALRHRLPGALVAWAVTSAFLVPVMELLGDRALPPGELVFAVGMNLIIALISGTQSGAFARQVRELDEARRALEHQAGHDPLTGLPNRARLARHAAGHGGQPLAVLLLDLNGFKKVNDEFGHAAGDKLLCEVGRRLRAVLRPADLAGRLGGDEFLVLLPGAGPAETAEVVDRLRSEIFRPVEVGGHVATVGVSIGAAYRSAGESADLDVLTAMADAAMYRDKSSVDSRSLRT